MQLLAPERVHRLQLHRAEQRLRRAGVPGPELVAEIVVPPFAGQVAETGVEHRVIEQATMIADASLARVGLRQAFEVGGVGGRHGFVEGAAHVQPAALGVAQGDVHRAAGEMRAGRLAAAARRRDELAGEPFQLGFAGPWVVRGQGAGQAVVEILLHGERPPGVQHHQAHAAGEGGGDPQETLEDLAASVALRDRVRNSELVVGRPDAEVTAQPERLQRRAGIDDGDAGHGVPVGLRENGDGLGEVGHGVN